MPRGQASAVGEERLSPNGYWYVKTPQGWRLKHHIIAEKALGREILKDEIVRFRDLDRTNLSPDNIEVIPKGLHSKAKRLATVEAKLEEWNKEYYSLTGSVYVYHP
jgi:hypothetical protein